METQTISFLPLLYESERICRNWKDAGMNDCGVFTEELGAKYYRSGAYNKYPFIDVHLAKRGESLYFSFGYMTGGRMNFYGHGSPLSEDSYSIGTFVPKPRALREIEKALFNKLEHDRNLDDKERKNIMSAFKRIEPTLQDDL